jgi:hypothetical protein
MLTFNRLATALKEYGRPVRVAFEATGNYHRALAYYLATAGFEIKLVSSVALARTREALNNSWDKNDPKDAQVILHMMEIGNEQYYHDPLVCGTNDIQELSKTHDIVSKSKTELWHRVLTHYLPLYFPEAGRFYRSSRSDWFFAFLERYPSPHLITAMGKAAFTADAWDVIGRKVAKERLLADIYETAKYSVGLPVAPDSDAIRMFRLVLGEGRSLIAQRNQIEDRAVALLKDLPDYQLLTSIPGIGPIKRFDHPRRSWRLTPFWTSSAVLEVLRHALPGRRLRSNLPKGTWQPSVGHIPGPNQAVKIRECPFAPHPMDGWSGCHSAAHQQLPG